tara:strand:+ start:10884 stop:11093 length:210 start_codon:yes stop_codon:yes gene_type:complete
MREYAVKTTQEQNGEFTHELLPNSELELGGTNTWNRATYYEVKNAHEKLIKRNGNMIQVETKVTDRLDD